MEITITEYHILHALAIDSIYGVLSWYDRATVHQFLNHKISPEEISPKAHALIVTITENKIEAPEMRYMDDRLLYYKQIYTDEKLDLKPEWLSIYEYSVYHSETTAIIKNTIPYECTRNT
ncbi:hypothetical protein [Elizabethkingia miricola]|uniref:hypothetical protein n=1 Tax=Elizabethkingia miricola TaxID=172045 RepID=UPI000B352037|nr:hypothetical protein [Elizabethkingia miricola]